MKRLFILFYLCLATTAMAASDMVATFVYQDGNTIRLAMRDKNHVRMETTPDSYMLLKDEKVYSVSRDENGQWTVMDMDQLKQFGSSGLSGLFGGGSAKAPEYEVKYIKTGRSEKIAGYKGTVYQVEIREDGQVVDNDEIVLSVHSDIVRINGAWAAIGEKMAASVGDQQSKSLEAANREAHKAGFGGMIRYGNDMKLKQLEKKSLGSSYFDLPDGAQQAQMGSMPDMSGTKAGETTDQYGEDGLSTAGEAREEESGELSADDVTKGVKKLFEGLFN